MTMYSRAHLVSLVTVVFASTQCLPAFCLDVSGLAHKGLKKVTSGMASFYADVFNGRKTASGERFDNSKLTCAHRSLPFGTKILVANPHTGKICVVTVTDRGPFHPNRVVDLSKAAAHKLGISGVGHVVCFTGKAIAEASVKSVSTVADLMKLDDDDEVTIATTPAKLQIHSTVKAVPADAPDGAPITVAATAPTTTTATRSAAAAVGGAEGNRSADLSGGKTPSTEPGRVDRSLLPTK